MRLSQHIFEDFQSKYVRDADECNLPFLVLNEIIVAALGQWLKNISHQYPIIKRAALFWHEIVSETSYLS